MRKLTFSDIDQVNGGLGTGDVAGSALGSITGTAVGLIVGAAGAPLLIATAIGLLFSFASSIAWAAATETPDVPPPQEKTPSVEVRVISPEEIEIEVNRLSIIQLYESPYQH